MAKCITYDTREAWLEGRREGLGSSDAAAVLGASKWGTPLSVWIDKTGRAPDPDPDDTRFTKAGKYLERPVAQWFTDETEVTVHFPDDGKHTTYVSEQWPMLRATPDFFVNLKKSDSERLGIPKMTDANGDLGYPCGRGILEIKTTAAWLADDWVDGPPLYYMVQVQHQLAVLGLQWAFVAVLIGGNDMRWFFVQRDHAFCEILTTKLETFWRDFVDKDAEPPVARGMDGGLLKELYPGHTEGVTIELDASWIAVDEQLERAKERKKQASEDEARLKAKIVQAIGGAESALLPNGVKYTHKTQQRKASVRKIAASEFRVLRRAKPKK